MDRAAAVYAVNEKLVVVSCPKTPMGLRLDRDPIVLPLTSPPDILGAAIDAAMRASEMVLPHPAPDEWKGAFDAVLKAGGVRSLKTFMASARLVNVDQADDGVIVQPNENCGAKDGFQPLPLHAEVVPSEVSAVGAAVLRLLD